MADRYEINHEGLIVVGESALCSNQSKMLVDLFSQFGWNCKEIDKQGSCHVLHMTNPSVDPLTINVFSGTIRNEARNAYEKKIQLGTTKDPRRYSKKNTIILGIYVYEEDDSFKDAIFVGYSIDDNINYDTNPSIRGTFVNRLLLQAKTKGFVYDKEHNSVGFRSEFAYYYLDNFYNIHYNNADVPQLHQGDAASSKEDKEIKGANILLYGVPGAGKSHEIDSIIDKERSERVVFHPDYSYSDFVGQILPRLNKNDDGKEVLEYIFEEGPFTKILRLAHNDTDNMHYLVIEELNRGNAPAIFGDIFQLLDREDDGSSKYKITNYDIAKKVFGEGHEDEKIAIPSNLTILATMNTSDQNVFTLDTAFQRRWDMRLIKNDISAAKHADVKIERSDVCWRDFAIEVNNRILEVNENVGSFGDKRLGAYFAKRDELCVERFAGKVLKYLWDDAFKMNHDMIFVDSINSLELLIETFKNAPHDPLAAILRPEIYTKMKTASTVNDSDSEHNDGDENVDNEGFDTEQ